MIHFQYCGIGTLISRCISIGKSNELDRRNEDALFQISETLTDQFLMVRLCLFPKEKNQTLEIKYPRQWI